jgi:hypothetical protein
MAMWHPTHRGLRIIPDPNVVKEIGVLEGMYTCRTGSGSQDMLINHVQDGVPMAYVSAV